MDNKNSMFAIISYIIVVWFAVGFTKLANLITGVTSIFSEKWVTGGFIFETINYAILIIIALVIWFKSASDNDWGWEWNDNSKKSFIEMLGDLFSKMKETMWNSETPVTSKIILVGTNIVFIVGFYLMMYLVLNNLSNWITQTLGWDWLSFSSFFKVIWYYAIFGITAWAFVYVFSSVFTLLEKIAEEIWESGINKFYTKILLAFFSLIWILVVYTNVYDKYVDWAGKLAEWGTSIIDDANIWIDTSKTSNWGSTTDNSSSQLDGLTPTWQ